jgi:Flp pilus assembly protein TadG
MEQIDTVESGRSGQSRPRFLPALRSGERSGQAIVEFALVSFAFFSIVFGTIDFGRAVYMYSELSNSVREGARYGKVDPSNGSAIKATVRDKAPALGGSDAEGNALLTVDDPICTGGCYQGCADVTVSAQYSFTPVVARFLGIDAPIVMKASAKVEAE